MLLDNNLNQSSYVELNAQWKKIAMGEEQLLDQSEMLRFEEGQNADLYMSSKWAPRRQEIAQQQHQQTIVEEDEKQRNPTEVVRPTVNMEMMEPEVEISMIDSSEQFATPKPPDSRNQSCASNTQFIVPEPDERSMSGASRVEQ